MPGYGIQPPERSQRTPQPRVPEANTATGNPPPRRPPPTPHRPQGSPPAGPFPGPGGAPPPASPIDSSTAPRVAPGRDLSGVGRSPARGNRYRPLAPTSVADKKKGPPSAVPFHFSDGSVFVSRPHGRTPGHRPRVACR